MYKVVFQEIEIPPSKPKAMIKKLLILPLLLIAALLQSQELYKEYYRPQFHLSPEWGWMGDPNGMIYFDGKYHILWWGHAMTSDLVHWVQYNNNAMQGGPGGFGYWSGSVVVDNENTAGFNTAEDTAMIAVYTMHYNNGVEKVGISSSLNHVSFQYYEGNPVIATEQTNFRDPQVFWHQQTSRWIMAITRSLERAVEFYASTDLKNWEYLSSFNLRGAKDQVWEVPDLVQLPLNDDPTNMKWVLICGMGPNKVQFWVGDFDGTNFTLDSADNHYTGKHVSGTIFESFEGTDFGNWVVTGDAFGTGPVTDELPEQMEVNGHIGRSYVNSYHNGDAATGMLVSPDFIIANPFINYLIGGGMGAGQRIKLVIGGTSVRSSTSLRNQETLRWDGWDVSDLVGQTAHIEIIDNATSGWGHILVDHIVFSDELYNTKVENANWADWGTDFYAARTYRNYSPIDKDRTVWIGWMGNWAYANNVPTSPWKGHQAMPRTIKLVDNGKGYQLIQHPVEEFEQLRDSHYLIENTVVSDSLSIEGFQPEWNVFELKVKFKISSRNQKFGINLADEGSGKRLIIGYNAKTSQLYIDRRKAGTYQFSPAFPTIMYAPTPFPVDSILDLHIFMDQSSIELFANNYQTSISALVLTKPGANNISVFSENEPVSMMEFEAWKLNSIWGVTPDQLPNAIPEKTKKNQSFIYPNPLTKGQEFSLSSNDNAYIKRGTLSINDLFGRDVFSRDIADTFLSEVDLGGISARLPRGQYIFQIRSETFILSEKLIIL